MCSHHNNIPINIPGHPYGLMNRSILCNCDIEAESNFLLESLAACKGPVTKSDLEMHFYSKFGFCKLFQRYNGRIRYTNFTKVDNLGTDPANIT